MTLLGYLMLALSAQAASFDCGKAQSATEKAICADPKLSVMDEELQQAYQQALRKVSKKRGIIIAQQQWLKNERNTCYENSNITETECIDPPGRWTLPDCPSKKYECLISKYQARIDELTKESNVAVGAFRLVDFYAGDEEMCRTYGRNLNSFPAWPPQVCERPLNPKFKELSRPEWRVWTAEELWERRELIKRITIEIDYSNPSPTRPQFNEDAWLKVHKRNIEAKSISISEARVRRHSGEVLWLLKFDTATNLKCGWPPASLVDPDRAIYIAYLNEQKELEENTSGMAGRMLRMTGAYDIFLYNGEFRDDYWKWHNDDFTEGELETLHCKFEYHAPNAQNLTNGEMKK